MEYPFVDLYYESYGQGFPVIFIHGFSLSHVIWEPVIPYLKADARLILPDLRGHGNSPAPEGPYSMRMMAEDVMALMDKLQLEKAIWVGHSMGGYISQAMARHHPERLAGLAFVATRPLADSPEKLKARSKTINQIREQGVRVVAEDMSERLTYKSDWKVTNFNIINHTPQSGMIGSLQGMASRPDSSELVRNLSLPWVLVAGQEDRFAPLEIAREMAAPLDASHYFEVPKVGHMPMMEAPEVVAQAIRVLLADVESEN